jgi:hypothetical protein
MTRRIQIRRLRARPFKASESIRRTLHLDDGGGEQLRPFKGFRMEAIDHWPKNVIDLCAGAD